MRAQPIKQVNIKATSILDEAQEAVNGRAMADYGDPKDNFRRWSALCCASGRTSMANISAEDLCHIMILGKLSRDTNNPKRDNAVDIAGYAEILDLVRGL